jgi:hypothetical protein
MSNLFVLHVSFVEMMRITLAAVAACAAAHEWLECPEGDSMNPEVAACLAMRAEMFHREPKWVAQFSTAAAGPEQIWINYHATPDSMAVRYISANPNSLPGVKVSCSEGSTTLQQSVVQRLSMELSLILIYLLAVGYRFRQLPP